LGGGTEKRKSAAGKKTIGGKETPANSGTTEVREIKEGQKGAKEDTSTKTRDRQNKEETREIIDKNG